MLACLTIAIQRDADRLDVGGQELGGARLAQHILAHRAILPGQRGECVDPVRVRQEPAVSDHVRVERAGRT